MSHIPVSHSQKIYGLLGVAALTLISYCIVSLPGVSQIGISSLIVAIILGIIVGNTWKHPASWTPGIQFAAKRLLRTAIILYGFRITFQQIISVGWQAVIIDIVVVVFTLVIGYWVGRKLLKLDRDLSLLISAGSAICGAAAVLAVEDILKSEPYKAAVAIATVVLFGTTCMFLYPALQQMGVFQFTPKQYGIFTGASIHEVAQAVVAGANVDIEAGKIAVIVKMMRVLLLVPVLFVFAFYFNHLSDKKQGKKTRIIVPWFALGFVLVIAFNSLQLLPQKAVDSLIHLDMILLTMAMGAIGIETKLSKMKQVGLKPLYLAVVLFAWLMTSVYLMVSYT